MNDTAIQVEGVSKLYHIGANKTYKTARESLMSALSAPLRLAKQLARPKSEEPDPTDLWALKDVSFEVKRGEVVGIIGRNGAGKSTLLKVLARITEPTKGRISIHGRVGSLLEVGTGFHPELSGRENVFLNGAILGMRRAEIISKFDEIVAFAEVEKFIDTPVKHYSSGMYMRLAFAVAAHLEPEILIVDEVLAVGDMEFQKKCMGKMNDVAQQGRTVLFVSHNLAAIRQLCTSGVMLQRGRAVSYDKISNAVDSYINGGTEHGNILTHVNRIDKAISVTEITVNGSSNDELPLGDVRSITVEISGTVHEQLQMEMEVRVMDMYGLPLGFFSPGHLTGIVPQHKAGDFKLTRSFQLPPMSRGYYYLNIHLTHPGLHVWMEAQQAVRMTFEGTPTATGHVFEYAKGAGWVLLGTEPQNKAAASK